MGAVIKNKPQPQPRFCQKFLRCKSQKYERLCNVRDENPDHIIMHVGTNDFNSENNPERVVKSIVDLAKGVVSEKREVPVSEIILRNDK